MANTIFIPTKRIRNYAYKKHVHNWEIAERIGVSDSTLTRLFRHAELPESKAMEIYAAVDEIARQKGSYDDGEELPR